MSEQESIEAWYYVLEGKRNGPVSMDDIKALIESGKIRAETKVWHSTMGGEWKAAKDTELSEILAALLVKDPALCEPLPPDMPIEPPPIEPPPLPEDNTKKSSVNFNEALSSASAQGKRIFDEIRAYTVSTTADGKLIDDRFVWVISGIPIVGGILGLLMGDWAIAINIAANVTCCVLDDRQLKQAGHQSPVNWMVFVIPVYLWKRAELLNQKKYYFWAWCAAFVISMLIVSGSTGRIESVACDTVSDIIQNQLHRDVTCKRVKITQTHNDTHYGKALLSNGNEVRVRIQKRGKGQVYVEIFYIVALILWAYQITPQRKEYPWFFVVDAGRKFMSRPPVVHRAGRFRQSRPIKKMAVCGCRLPRWCWALFVHWHSLMILTGIHRQSSDCSCLPGSA